MVFRNSVTRAGYELLYTPLPPAAKRSAKSLIDVTGDSAGKALGAGLIFLLTRLGPVHSLTAVNLAIVVAAAMEFAVAQRLRAGYVPGIEDDDTGGPVAVVHAGQDELLKAVAVQVGRRKFRKMA